MKNQYTFQVPSIGTIRVKAKDLNDALLDVADAAGIQLVSAVEYPKRNLHLVRTSSPKRITHR